MTSDTSARRRSSARTFVFWLLMVPVWAFVAFDSINSFAEVTEVGDVTVLTLIMLFALWAWWYDEDRDRRAAARAASRNGDLKRADDDGS